MTDLGSLIKELPLRIARGSPATPIAGITEDTRTLKPGDLFIARKGLRHDARTLIPTALTAGAAAVLTDDPDAPWPADIPTGLAGHTPALLITADLPGVSAALAERFFGRPSAALRLVGVTGTNGKTTITYLTHQLIGAAGTRCGMIGTVCIDDGTTTTPATLTTPPAVELSRVIARMVSAGCGACVMETSSHSLDQGRVAALSYVAAAFTNLSHDHLDYHATMEAYAAAKARLFEMLPADGLALMNADDPWHTRMARDCKAPVITCSVLATSSPDGPEQSPGGAPLRHDRDTSALQRHAGHISAQIIAATPASTRISLSVSPGATSHATPTLAHSVLDAASLWHNQTITIPLVGPHNVTNALQAALLALASVVQVQSKGEPAPASAHTTTAAIATHAARAILDALTRVKAPPGRLEPVTPLNAPVQAFVDYAHSDDSLGRVLDVLRQALDSHAVDTVPRTAPANPGTPASSCRLICVMGCGGDRDKAKRPIMGRTSATKADITIVTSDNPRTEDPASIIAQIVAGVPPELRPRLRIEPDRAKAIALAASLCRPGDVLLIAGKGHEDYQIIADPNAPAGGPARTIKLHFDDREVTRAALAEHHWPTTSAPCITTAPSSTSVPTSRLSAPSAVTVSNTPATTAHA